MKTTRETLESVLTFAAPAWSSRPSLSHVKVAEDGGSIVACNGIALAIAPVEEGGDLAGKILDAEALRAFLKLKPIARDVTLVPSADGTHAVAGSPRTGDHDIPYINATFPEYRQYSTPYSKDALTPPFAWTNTMMTNVAKATKGRTIRIYPGESNKTQAVITVAPEHGDGELTLKIVVMPAFVTW